MAKLKEFTASFRNDGRRDDGLYHLALSHHGNAEYEEAIAVIGSLVEQYPRTSYMANALYLGGNWANDSAMEEQVIYFHQKFLNDFKSDQRYAVVRDQLSTLYLGRELFVQAAAIHKHEAESRTLSSEERLKHALAWLSIEVRYGSPSRVLVAAKLVDEQASSNDDARAIAIAARIKVYSQQQKFSEVQKSIRELRQLDQASSYVREALGEAMLLLANIESQKWSPDVFNLALRDPLATMNDQYTTYNKVRSMFEAVCSSTESGWCAPAQFQLARFSENAIASFEDFSIPETLASKDIKEFNVRKEAILMGIASIAQSADQRAHAGIAQGGIKPEWAQQIIWNNTTDWDTYRITDETGQGYLQWSPALTSGNH